MAKKKQVSGKKKKTATTKKPTASKKKTSSAKKPLAISKRSATTAKKLPFDPANSSALLPADVDPQQIHQQRVDLLPAQLIEDTINDLRLLMDDFSEVTRDNLTALERRRKRGAGIRNYGFIDKASDLAVANPRFVQFFNISNLKNAIRNIEACREIVILLQSFQRVVSNSMLVYSDEALTMALIFYNMVREMSRRGDPEAMAIFNALRPFFRRTRRITEEPTEKELERDLHALIHGKADGKLVVENFSPAKSGGARKVIDDVHRGKAMMKESAEAQEEN